MAARRHLLLLVVAPRKYERELRHKCRLPRSATGSRAARGNYGNPARYPCKRAGVVSSYFYRRGRVECRIMQMMPRFLCERHLLAQDRNITRRANFPKGSV
jgi:hypothetical protein